MKNQIMKIVNSLTDKQLQKLNRLYQNEWWCRGRTLEDTENVVSGSSIIFCAIIDDDLVGFSRVLTDYIFKALIFDVIVDPGCRDTGIGSTLMCAIKNHEQLRSVKHFELYCRSDMIPYYEKHGFTDDIGDICFMRYEPN